MFFLDFVVKEECFKDIQWAQFYLEIEPFKDTMSPHAGRKPPPPNPGLFFLGGPRCWAQSAPMVANKVRLI